MFDYMLVHCNPNNAGLGVGTAYCIGTFAYCARYALLHGLRAQTHIIRW